MSRQHTQLLQAAAEGDEAAWDALVERFSPLVDSIARSFRLDRADAADVSQTVWLRLLEHVGRLRDPERVGAWLASTARHECLRTLRLARRELASGDDAVFERGGSTEPLDARLLRAERDAELTLAFEAQPQRCRLLLRVVTEEPAPSYEEVAASTGMAVGSVGPNRTRCLAGLRRSVLATG
ncbi:MAG: RNA polymerase sigma factor [Gaiellaceae bacterium]|jgi:RNA polymerase sigma factor (sigma-70 family)